MGSGDPTSAFHILQPFICALSHYPSPGGEVPIVIHLVGNKRIKYIFLEFVVVVEL